MTPHFHRLNPQQRAASYRLAAAQIAISFKSAASNVIKFPSPADFVDAYIAGRRAPELLRPLVAEYSRLAVLADEVSAVDRQMNALYDAMVGIVEAGAERQFVAKEIA